MYLDPVRKQLRGSPDDYLTPRQLEVLGLLLTGWQKSRQFSRRELMAALGIASPNGITNHLRPLARKGVLELRPQRSGQRGATARTLRPLVRFITAADLGKEP